MSAIECVVCFDSMSTDAKLQGTQVRAHGLPHVLVTAGSAGAPHMGGCQLLRTALQRVVFMFEFCGPCFGDRTSKSMALCARRLKGPCPVAITRRICTARKNLSRVHFILFFNRYGFLQGLILPRQSLSRPLQWAPRPVAHPPLPSLLTRTQ